MKPLKLDPSLSREQVKEALFERLDSIIQTMSACEIYQTELDFDYDQAHIACHITLRRRNWIPGGE